MFFFWHMNHCSKIAIPLFIFFLFHSTCWADDNNEHTTTQRLFDKKEECLILEDKATGTSLNETEKKLLGKCNPILREARKKFDPTAIEIDKLSIEKDNFFNKFENGK